MKGATLRGMSTSLIALVSATASLTMAGYSTAAVAQSNAQPSGASQNASTGNNAADPSGSSNAPTGLLPQAGDNLAQQGSISNDSPTGDTGEVVITGTNISGVKPVGSEAVTLDRETILSTGVSSVADAVRTLPQVRNLGDFREGGTQGSYNSQQGNAINLRGLGQQATLTLVDGHRVVATGAASNFTEANQVPIAAIARIEVIVDGASAVYGSDAVAGVVNFVLRKDYDGIEASARLTNQVGGFEYAPSITAGKTWGDLAGLGNGNILVSYEYGHRNPYLAGQNKFLRQNLTPLGGPDNRLNGTTATLAGPANIYVQNADGSANPVLARAGAYTYYGLPQGDNVGLSASQLLLNQPNLADSSNYTDYTGRVSRHQFTLFANQNLGPSVEAFVQGTYSHRHTFSRSLSTMVQNVTLSPFLYDTSGKVTTTPNPYYISGIPGVAPGAPLNVQYSAIKDLGSSNFDNTSRTYSITGGLRVKLPAHWKAEAYYTYGRDKACNFCQSDGFNVNPTALQYQINIGALNPLSSKPLSATEIATFTGPNIQSSGNGIDDAVVKLDGPLFSLPAGPIKAALGAERDKSYNFNINGANRNNNNLFVYDTTEQTSRLSRTVWSAFAELYFPIISEDMNVPLMQSLTFDGAVRYDHYSDVGKTTNPKFGGTWTVNDKLSFRGSWGTSFRAPSLPDVNLYSYSSAFGFPGSNKDPRVTNGYLNLPGAGLTLANVALVLGSNPGLKPEKAKTWSFGSNLRLGDFDLEATYYAIKYSDRISSPNAVANYLAGNYPGYGGYAQYVYPINNPSTCTNSNIKSADPTLQKYLGETILYGGLPNFCAVNVLIDQRNTNLAATKQNGIDGTITYNHRFNEVAVNASLAASWTISDKEQVVKGQPFTDRLGFYNTPVEWRGRGSLGALWRGISGNLFVNYTGSYTNDLAIDSRGNTIAPQKVGDWVTFDMTLGYGTAFKSPAMGLLKGLRASLTLQNLFNRDPRTVITSQGGYNGQYSNPYGRTYTVQLTANF